MRHTRTTPPQLCSAKDCDASLSFAPQTAWPNGLPAVAVNNLILAGWGQKLVFNHTIDPADSAEIASLVRSLYFELSFGEIAQLVVKAKSHPWFPIHDVIRKFQMDPTPEFFALCEFFHSLPQGFQTWCVQRKISSAELLPLTIAKDIQLKPLLHKILNLKLSRVQGATMLELVMDLLVLGKSLSELHLTENHIDETAHAWYEHIKRLRFPEINKRDWAGTSQARWTLQGTNPGLEVKLFVSDPSDTKISDLLELGVFDTTKPN